MLIPRPFWARFRLFLFATALALGSGCADQLVQTASMGPDLSTAGGGQGGALATLEAACGEVVAASELPLGEEFGEGDVPTSTLWFSDTYAPLEGPGLYVRAHGAARLYVNGALIKELTATGETTFVPLSLTPGENVLALAVAASAGPPAVLAQFDDLSRSYISDETWKVTSTPSGDWEKRAFDDSTWSAAHAYGRYGDLPGCDPTADFPTTSDAKWIGAAPGSEGPIALRTVIHIDPEGFGEGTTGGGTTAPILVSTFADLQLYADSDTPRVLLLPEGTLDFRRTGAAIATQDVCPAVCTSNAAKTLYTVLVGTSTCSVTQTTMPRTEQTLKLGSNKTIIGLGRGAALRGLSIDFQASSNIILRNLTLYDVNRDFLEAGDALGIYQPSKVWVDHLTAKWISDGLIDVLAGSKGITLSRLHLDGDNPAECEGADQFMSTITDSEVSLHHSRLEHAKGRSPLAYGPTARVHLWNNYFANSLDWTVGSGCGAHVLLEGSTFENVEVATRITSCAESGVGLIDAKTGTNLYRDSSNAHMNANSTEPHDNVFVPNYEYTLELANDAWPNVVSRAGAGGPWALPLTLN